MEESKQGRSKYKNSKARLTLILIQTAAICYTIFSSTTTNDAKILGALLLPMSYLAFKSWREK